MHRLEIEVPTSLTEKNSQLHMQLFSRLFRLSCHERVWHRRSCLWASAFLSASLCAQAPAASAQQPAAPAAPVQPTDKPSISLSPAVVMAKGNFGQGLTQTLTLTIKPHATSRSRWWRKT